MDRDQPEYVALTPEWEERVLSFIMVYSRNLSVNANSIEQFRQDLSQEKRPEVARTIQENLEQLQEIHRAMTRARHKFATWLGLGDQYPANPD